MQAYVKAIAHYLPETRITTAELAQRFPEWSVEKIQEKTGINVRYIAAPDQCSSDLGVLAAQKLFEENPCAKEDIDFIIFCSQSHDHPLPATACLIQDRLGIPRTIGACDIGLGCSGYVYGLGMAKGLIETGQATNVLLITAETYSKYLHPDDKRVQTIFSDGAAATWVGSRKDDGLAPLGPFVYGTDGGGAKNLIIKQGGLRQPFPGPWGLGRTENFITHDRDGCLFMNGPEIFKFTLRVVPRAVNELLGKARIPFGDIDLFVFHQANIYILQRLRDTIDIPENKFLLDLSEVGNTVSSTIPIALARAFKEDRVEPGTTAMLVGFGVGYSWGACIMRHVG
ncbi:MAG: ketoacyl-ACP synthase III [Desulfovibrio sp.]|mgnify:FL=1|nr:MAG: ketoacyl-ACP synthase III [Desulfovibrio sp.]